MRILNPNFVMLQQKNVVAHEITSNVSTTWKKLQGVQAMQAVQGVQMVQAVQAAHADILSEIPLFGGHSDKDLVLLAED